MTRKKKICITCNTEQYIFSKGECKRCASIRYSKKSGCKEKKPIRKVSKKQSKQLKVYSTNKKAKLDEQPQDLVQCFIGGEMIGKNQVELHHIDGREESKLTDMDRCVFTCRKHHRELHDLMVLQLLKKRWYAKFLLRLKERFFDVYKKEMFKQVRALVISDDEYLEIVS